MQGEVFSLEHAVASAEQALARGATGDAEWQYRRLLLAAGGAKVVEFEYEEWVRRLSEVYAQLGRIDEAALLRLYLHDFVALKNLLARTTDSPLAALVLEALGKWPEAAASHAAAGRRVRAAIAHEKAGAWQAARDLWQAIAADPRLGRYEAALALYNVAACTRRAQPGTAAAAELARAQRLLEEVADEHEGRGERERAFDCYQLLLQLGKDSGAYENVAEGYLSCIRVLDADGLTAYVLQYYDDFIAYSLEKGERHAAATLCREAADVARRAGRPYDLYYLRRAAAAWTEAADEAGTPEVAEGALKAAATAWVAASDFGEARAVYHRLAGLPLDEPSRARWRAAASRLDGAPAAPPAGTGLPDALKQASAYANVWHVDLVEWELSGDAEAIAAGIVGDLRFQSATRQRALNLCLHAADARVRHEPSAPAVLVRRAELLGDLQSYLALSALEVLAAHTSPEVRRAALKAVRRLQFKRSFAMVQRGLADGDSSVREAAVEAIRGLTFGHAYQPLVRLLRENADPRVRAAAVDALGRLRSLEAAEVLIGVLRHGEPELRSNARRALATLDHPDLAQVLRRHLEVEREPEARQALLALVER